MFAHAPKLRFDAAKRFANLCSRNCGEDPLEVLGQVTLPIRICREVVLPVRGLSQTPQITQFPPVHERCRLDFACHPCSSFLLEGGPDTFPEPPSVPPRCSAGFAPQLFESLALTPGFTSLRCWYRDLLGDVCNHGVWSPFAWFPHCHFHLVGRLEDTPPPRSRGFQLRRKRVIHLERDCVVVRLDDISGPLVHSTPAPGQPFHGDIVQSSRSHGQVVGVVCWDVHLLSREP